MAPVPEGLPEWEARKESPGEIGSNLKVTTCLGSPFTPLFSHPQLLTSNFRPAPASDWFTAGCCHHPWPTTPGSQPCRDPCWPLLPFPNSSLFSAQSRGPIPSLSDYVICQNPPAAHSRQGTHPGPQDVLVGGCYRPSVLVSPTLPLPPAPAPCLLLASSQTCNHAPASGPLHWLFPQPGVLFPLLFQGMLPFVNYRLALTKSTGFPGGSDGKASVCNVGDPGSIPGPGRSPGEGNGNPLQYPCLEISMEEKPGGLQSMGSRRVGHD